MNIIGLGKINVPSAGTPVPFSATTRQCDEVIVTFDPADTTAAVFIKDASGNKIASMKTGDPAIKFCAEGSSPIDLTALFADADGNDKGPLVGIVER